MNELDDVNEAFYISQSGKPGSVHIDLPKCVLMDKIKKDTLINKNQNNKKKMNKAIDDTNTEYCLKNITDLINSSEKPVIIAGKGCNNYDKMLRELAIKGNIPITTTIHGMGVFDENHKLSLEFLGMHGSVYANYAVQEADLIIALGSRFDDRTTGVIEKYAPNAFDSFKKKKGGIIHVNIEESEINKVVKSHFNYNMDCGDFLNNLSPNIKYKSRDNWLNKINNWKLHFPFIYKKQGKQL